MAKRALVPYGSSSNPTIEPYTENEENNNVTITTTTAQASSSQHSAIALHPPWKKQKTDNGSSYIFESSGHTITQDPRLACILPPTNVPLPTAEISSEEDVSTMIAIDKLFMAIRGMPKVYQKRVKVRDDDYLMIYGWEYAPDFYLDNTTLVNLKNTHPAILNVLINPTGGCCSKESNKIIGIATPCYCDNCAYERGKVRVTGSVKQSVPPPSPKASWGRFMIVVQPASHRV